MTRERTREVHEDDPHDHDRGLSFDISTLMNRRRALGLFAVGGLATLVGCGSSSSESSDATASAATSASTPSTTPTVDGTAAATTETPEETGGPVPADGSKGVNVLSPSGIVHSDITSSFGSASGVAEGVPLTIALTILDVSTGGTPLAGAAVYPWHCDRATTRSIRPTRSTRTICGGYRRRTPMAPSRSRASSRPHTRAAGHTCTLRSSRASARPPGPDRS